MSFPTCQSKVLVPSPIPKNEEIDYILSGSFNSTSLYLLAFNQSTSELSVSLTIPAYGPHQYLYYDRTRQRAYATSWALPAQLSSWSIDLKTPKIELLNMVPITSTSSYITMNDQILYSVGGPTGELHHLDKETGLIKEKIQELLFVPQSDLINEDKTRKALRYGSHAIEIDITTNRAFVAHLGHNSIFMYQVDPETKTLSPISETKSPRPHDGPRHCVISEDGKWLYGVTEHTQYVDLYKIETDSLVYQISTLIIPSDDSHDISSDPNDYRGDTIRILPSQLKKSLFSSTKDKDRHMSKNYIFATTRGKDPQHQGVLTVLEQESNSLKILSIWPTPTCGGKANAIEFRIHDDGNDSRILIVLTDDEVGWVMVLEWNPFSEVPIKLVSKTLIDQPGIGASHALWL
ncbi:Lactonase, 7-bladed beta-propeller-domain-containing protein [Melampsora americana]|nr:Lactonase, 7-bladed beta-propeller-domain-containing protein [Melampsora americana]